MAGQQLPCCAVATGKEDAVVGDSWAVRHLNILHVTGHAQATIAGVKVTPEEIVLCNLAS